MPRMPTFFNTLEEKQIVSSSEKVLHYAGQDDEEIISYDNIVVEQVQRYSSGNSELDRVLGGGFVPGSVVVLSGDPGVGKSTLTLQTTAQISKSKKSLYVSGGVS